MNSSSYSFIGGDRGSWKVASAKAMVGEGLGITPFLDVRNEYVMRPPVDFSWVLRGVVANRCELAGAPKMVVSTALRDGPQETRAALVPVRKNPEWWEMSNGERDRISRNRTPAVMRDLEALSRMIRVHHHCRDLGEPFDFLSWFEFSSREEPVFHELLGSLRDSEEWSYVEREIDLRLIRVAG